LQRFPESISINLDLSNHYDTSVLYTRSCLATFFALVTSNTKIDSFEVDNDTFLHVGDILEHGRAGFMASMSANRALKTLIFHWGSSSSENSALSFIEFFRSAHELRHLEFNICMLFHDEVSDTKGSSLRNVPSEVFQAGHDSKLGNLALLQLRISEKDSSHILQQCQSTLRHLNLRRARLSSSDGGWKHIGETILKVPKRLYLQVQIKYAVDAVPAWEAFACTAVENGKPLGINIRGRENFVRASERSSRLGVSLFEQLG
jgi:hypothetical protein